MYAAAGARLAACDGGGTALVSDHGCACTGKSNPHGYGAWCKRWEVPDQRPWCYVAAECPSSHPLGDYGRFDECPTGDAHDGARVPPAESPRRPQDRGGGSKLRALAEAEAEEEAEAAMEAEVEEDGGAGGASLVSDHGCACTGRSNPHGYGAWCKRWEVPGQRPWCYVAAECPSPHPLGDYGRFDECPSGDAYDGYRASRGTVTPPLPSLLPAATARVYAPATALLAAAGRGHSRHRRATVSDHGCPCTGRSNPHGYGAWCKRWEVPGQRPWCYVAAECPSPHPLGDYGRFDECPTGDAHDGGGAADAPQPAQAADDAAALGWPTAVYGPAAAVGGDECSPLLRALQGWSSKLQHALAVGGALRGALRSQRALLSQERSEARDVQLRAPPPVADGGAGWVPWEAQQRKLARDAAARQKAAAARGGGGGGGSVARLEAQLRAATSALAPALGEAQLQAQALAGELASLHARNANAAAAAAQRVRARLASGGVGGGGGGGALGALQVGAADEVAAATRELVAEDKLTQRSREAEDALRRGAAGAVASK